MYYYQHHIGDFIRDTARLNDAQCMAYLRLLWIYYDTEKPLSDDHEKLAFQIGANPSDVRQILDHYFALDANAMRTNDRVEKELNIYRSKSDKARNSANARWNNTNAMRTQYERNANASKNDANQEPRTNNQNKPRATRLAKDWVLPKDWGNWALDEKPDWTRDDVLKVADCFKDYWIAKAGKDGSKLDWEATWRNWVRNTKGK